MLTHLETTCQACDTIDNINQEVYLEMSQAAAYVLNVSAPAPMYLTNSNITYA